MIKLHNSFEKQLNYEKEKTMTYKKYADKPINVRLFNEQSKILNELITDEQYCATRGIYSVSDIVRNNINSTLKEYEMNKLGTG